MKNLLSLFFLLILFSCKKNDLPQQSVFPIQYNISHYEPIEIREFEVQNNDFVEIPIQSFTHRTDSLLNLSFAERPRINEFVPFSSLEFLSFSEIRIWSESDGVLKDTMISWSQDSDFIHIFDVSGVRYELGKSNDDLFICFDFPWFNYIGDTGDVDQYYLGEEFCNLRSDEELLQVLKSEADKGMTGWSFGTESLVLKKFRVWLN